MNLPAKYFPGLTDHQLRQYEQMESLYNEWNVRINVISRKDMAQFSIHHLLHSLAIAKVVSFKPGTSVMDAGTGGGFPGIPLAVMFPEVKFTLIDSVGKKIKVIDAIAAELNLENVTTLNSRFETITGTYDFITGRAVSALPIFVAMVKDHVNNMGFNDIPNGILYLTGGDVENDIRQLNASCTRWSLADFFTEEYFTTKKVLHFNNFS
jgi:16S rRNA (guanine527-N7)-methyltransferase